MAEVKIKQGIVSAKGNQGIKSLADALAEESRCGCGIDCCYGYLTLPNWNSTTGSMEYVALYVIDGALVIDSVDNAKSAIQAIKNT